MALRSDLNLHTFATTSQLGQAAVAWIAGLSSRAIAGRGRFTVALSGGSLTKILGPALVTEPIRSQIDWSNWHVFWADERCVPLEDADSNYRLAREEIFEHVPIPGEQIYTLDDSLDPAPAATLYQTVIAHVFKPAAGQWPRFDLMLLGLGEDGHTASLFPNHRLLNETQRWVAPIFDSPKPPPQRITLTLPLLNNARQVAFITAGAGKAAILPHILETGASASPLPARLVRPTAGDLHWFIDEAAAAQLN